MLFNTKEKEKKTDKKRPKNSRSSSRDEVSGIARGSVTSISDVRLKNLKKRDISADNELSSLKEPGQNGTPVLTNQSDNIAHTYSFDIALPTSQKNFNKGDNQYSLSSLQ